MKKTLFLSIFLIMVLTFDLIWRKVADCAFSREFTDGLTAYSYHNFSKQTDILILGASGARYHINTDFIRDSLHKTCFNLGMDACGLYQQYASLKRCYKNGPISTVFLELSPMQMGHPINGEFTNISYFTPYYWKDRELKSVMDHTYGYEYTIRYLSSFVQFNGLFLDILVRLKNFHTTVNSTKTGYVPLEEINCPLYSGEDDLLDFDLHPICLELLEKMVKMCKDNKTRLVIILSPIQADWTCYTSWLHSYCLSNCIEFYDYTEDFRFRDSQYFRDGVHLNYRGANLFTKDLVNKIWMIN